MLIEYRPFRNNDAPLLADIWRSQAQQRGLMQPMSAALFEAQVLAKPTFDRLGLILALDSGKPIGFAHAAFGSTADEQGLSLEAGVISMLMLHAPVEHSAVADELLSRCEEYLQSRGARTIIAGGSQQQNPFYLGLYGGSELSGILSSDTAGQQFYAAHGYVEQDRAEVLHRDLAGFRPVIDRAQMQIRRRTCVHIDADPAARSWWDACTFGGFERTAISLDSRDSSKAVARAMLWDMELLASAWGVHASGLVELEVAPAMRRQGLATYVLGEAFRHLHSQGVALVEAQVPQSNAPARGLLAKLGFKMVDQSIIFRKDLATKAAPPEPQPATSAQPAEKSAE